VDEDGEPVSSAGNGDSKNKMPKRWEANLFIQTQCFVALDSGFFLLIVLEKVSNHFEQIKNFQIPL